MVSSVGTSRSILPARVTGHTLIIAIWDDDHCDEDERDENDRVRPSWWLLSAQGQPGPSRRSLSHWSSGCPWEVNSFKLVAWISYWSVSHWFVLNDSCLGEKDLIRAKRVVVKVTLPFLLIGMFILKQGQRFYIMIVVEKFSISFFILTQNSESAQAQRHHVANPNGVHLINLL